VGLKRKKYYDSYTLVVKVKAVNDSKKSRLHLFMPDIFVGLRAKRLVQFISKITINLPLILTLMDIHSK
jgi:hypothetical protein